LEAVLIAKKIIIIGSGFGGLAAGIRLASRGHQVSIYEQRDRLGGRAYVYQQDGFTFDGGPTVITAPYMFDELWKIVQLDREDYYKLVPLDPFYRIFDHERNFLDYNGDHEFILKQIEKFNPADKLGYTRFIEKTKTIFETGMALIDKPFLHVTDMLKVAPDLLRLESYRSVYGYVSKFIQDEFLRRCFSFHPLLIGGNPLDAASLYVLIHYLERNWGVHYALGGTGSIVTAMGRLFQELGGDIHLGTEIEEILVKDGKASGVRVRGGAEIKADIVISNGDVAYTYMNMIQAQHRRVNTDARIKHMRYSMSLFVIYFGTNKRYTDTPLRHHNIILSERYKGLLRDIFAQKDLPGDFSLYLHMPTYTDSSLAPAGHESFYVLSPVPNLKANIDWQQEAPRYRNTLMQFLEENYLPDLEEHLVAEHYIDPLHFQNDLNSYLGAGFSVQPTLLQSAWFRPHNQSEDIKNLYFVGAGTHPGAGLPGVLASAKIVDELIGGAPYGTQKPRTIPIKEYDNIYQPV
jgi:phytoene desaturase